MTRTRLRYLVGIILVLIVVLTLVGASFSQSQVPTTTTTQTTLSIEETEAFISSTQELLAKGRKMIDDATSTTTTTIPTTTTTIPTTTTRKVLPTRPRPTYSNVGLSDQEMKLFIYNHESGNDPARVNGSGCRGLGQACPGSKLPCGADYACQDAWFTNYALARYGSWAKAYSFWRAHSWW